MTIALPVASNPLKAIRQKCVDCSGGSIAEVAACTITRCALHPFRMGKNPHRKQQTDAQREAARARALANGFGSKAGSKAATPPPKSPRV